jgi:outer membrane lipoprotein-sorting protein
VGHESTERNRLKRFGAFVWLAKIGGEEQSSTMKLSLWLLALVCATCGSTGAQQLTDSLRIIEFSKQKVASYTSFSGEVTFMQRMTGDDDYYQGKVHFQAPALLREDVVMTQPFAGAASLLSVTGPDGVNWCDRREREHHTLVKSDLHAPNHAPGSIMGIIVDPSRKAPLRLGFAPDPSTFDYKLLKTEKMNGVDVYVMEGTPKPGFLAAQNKGTVGSAMRTQRVRIGMSDGFIHQMEQYYTQQYSQEDRLLRSVEFRNLRFNLPQPASLFTFTKPPGAQIIDLNQQMKLFPTR